MESEMNLQNSSPHFRGRTHLRDFVKDSMYREVQGSSAKAKTTDAAADLLPVLMYRDSPRLQAKMSDGYHGLYVDTRQRMRPDLKESARVRAELQEVPGYHSEPRKLTRSLSYQGKDGSSCSISKDSPRFSCDRREVDLPWDDPKSTLKLKGHPTFLLGVRNDQVQSLNDDSKSKVVFLNYMQMDRDELDRKVLNSHKRLGHQGRPPSVVAKLMGLETLPDPVSSCNIIPDLGRSYRDENVVKLSRSFAKADPCLLQPSSNFSKKLRKDSNTRWAYPDSSKKPMARVSNEPAPWNQIDGSRSSRKPGSRTTSKPHVKTPTACSTVYCEIEKRLKDLEFTRSGRDLRALKQILEAIQSKGLLGAENEGIGSNSTSQQDHQQKLLRYEYEARSVKNPMPESSQVLAYTKRRTSSSRNNESPILTMKPGNHVRRSGIPAASEISLEVISGQSTRQAEFPNNRNRVGSIGAATDLNIKSLQRHNTVNSASVKADRTIKSSVSSTRSQPLVKDDNIEWGKNSRSTSPRMQQRKLELEKRSQITVYPDSTPSRRQSSKQQGESNSPGSRQRLKNPGVLQSDEQLSEVNVVWNLNHHQNENSVQLNESIIWSSKNVVAGDSERSPDISSFLSPSMKASETVISSSSGKKSTLVLSEDKSSEFGFVPPEYSSPVSVLDDTVACKSCLPSPVKDVGKTLQDKGSDMHRGSLVDSFVSNPMDSDSTSLINPMKLQNIDNLVLNLRRLNSSHNEAHTNYIASLTETADLEHRYISEILLASGLLLREVGSIPTRFQYHSSEHPIKPELFLALERTKESAVLDKECSNAISRTQLMPEEKIHRMLIFDTVNEILARKLTSRGPFPPYHLLRPVTLARRWALNAQKLVRDMCSEIEVIQAKDPCCSSDEENAVRKDITNQLETWIHFDDGIFGAVLDIERLIFKDLVNEIVIGDSAGPKVQRPGRHRFLRRSFSFC